MTSVTPSSRVNSSMGLPTWYGCNVRTSRFAQRSTNSVIGSHHVLRVRTERLHLHRHTAHIGEYGFDFGRRFVAVEVDEKHVRPAARTRRAGFDASQADAVPMKRYEYPIQRARLVPGRYENRRLVAAARADFLAPDHEKPRLVVGMVFDVHRQHAQAISLRGHVARY